MAVKKTAKSSAKKTATKKAETKTMVSAKPEATKTAPKKTATKKAVTKAAAPKPATKTDTKKAATKKKAPAVKLTDKQQDLLKKVMAAGESGYLATKAETKGLESLQTKKLIKRGSKDKTSGSFRYSVSKAGEKHLVTPAPTPAPTA